jgi:YfiH family protein
MIVCKTEGLEYFQFDSLQNEFITQAIFTRKGGKSQNPWASLNVGNTVGDDPHHVKRNLTNILDALDYTEEQLAQVRQIHSSTVVRVDSPNDPGSPLPHADGMITNNPGVLLLMRFADCVPILLYDSDKKVIGIAHAGWKGTVLGIVAETVKKMQTEYGTSPSSLIAGIGPSIGPDHYQIGQDVIREVRRSFPKRWNEILIDNSDGVKFDLWKANRILLQEEGVKKIEVAEICTSCNLGDWYSHRGENGKTGRFAAAIGIKK